MLNPVIDRRNHFKFLMRIYVIDNPVMCGCEFDEITSQLLLTSPTFDLHVFMKCVPVPDRIVNCPQLSYIHTRKFHLRLQAATIAIAKFH